MRGRGCGTVQQPETATKGFNLTRTRVCVHTHVHSCIPSHGTHLWCVVDCLNEARESLCDPVVIRAHGVRHNRRRTRELLQLQAAARHKAFVSLCRAGHRAHTQTDRQTDTLTHTRTHTHTLSLSSSHTHSLKFTLKFAFRSTLCAEGGPCPGAACRGLGGARDKSRTERPG